MGFIGELNRLQKKSEAEADSRIRKFFAACEAGTRDPR